MQPDLIDLIEVTVVEQGRSVRVLKWQKDRERKSLEKSMLDIYRREADLQSIHTRISSP